MTDEQRAEIKARIADPWWFGFLSEQTRETLNALFATVESQQAALETARAENARLREALDIARKHLLNSDGFYFGPLNKAVIRSGTTQGGIERAQDGCPIGGITIHNYGQAVVQEMDAALAANETGAQE